MVLTAQQANDRLADITTKEQLRDLIRQLSVEASGKTTILYSGSTADGVGNSQIINSMLLNGEDIRVIDKTEAAKFLDVLDRDSPTYNSALANKLVELVITGAPSEPPNFLRSLLGEHNEAKTIFFHEASTGV